MLVNIGKVTKPSEQKQYTNIGRVSDEAQKRISGMNIKLPTLKEMFDNPQQSFSEAAKGNPIPSVYPTKGLIGNNQANMSLADRLNAGNSSAADKALLKMLSGNALTDTERASIEKGGLSSLLQNSSQLIDFSAPNNPANVKFTSQLKTLADKEMSGKKLTKQEQDMLKTAQLWVGLQKSSAQSLASLTDDTALNAYKSDITGAIDKYDRTAYGKNTDTPEGAVLKGLDRAELYIGTGVTNYMQGVANTINLIAGASGDETAGSNTPYAAASGALRDYFEKNGEKANIMLQDIVTNIAQNAVPMAASILTGGLGGGTAAARAASMAAFAPSVFGNAYKQGLEYGITDNRRLIPYALANTVLEVGLESLLSAKYMPTSGILSEKIIEKLAGKTSSAVMKAFLKLGRNMVGEFTEESLQSILDPLLAKYMLGADVSTVADDPFGALSQAAYEGFIGALSAALMGGAGAIGESVSEASLQNYGKQFNALMRATGTDVKNVAQYYAETSKDGRLTNAAQKVAKGDTSDLAVGEMRAMADEYSKDARKAVFTEIGKSVKASENGVNDILTLYEESVKGGLIFPARVDELYNEVNAFKENAEPETLGEFVYSVQAYAPKALILGAAARRINAEQPVDSGENAGYNSNIRGEDNGVYHDGRTAQNERELEEAGYEDAGGNREDARAWGESEEAFAARAQRNANKAGRGKRVLVRHGSGSLAYTEKSADNTQASRALMGAGFSGYYSARNAVRGNQQLKSVVKRLSEGEEVSADEIESVPKIAAALEKSRNAEETYSINTQERQELRDEAAEKLLNMGSYSGVDSSGKDAYNNDIRQERRIDIVIGPPAAGKSSVLVNPLSERHGSRVIDSDMAKELLPEFEGGVGASAVHRESQLISNAVLIKSVTDGDNIVYPIVGGGDLQKLINRIRFFKNAGYSVHLHLNELDINKALGRAISRFTETGRFIPPQVILDYRDTPTRNFEAIKNMEGLLDGYSHYSNDVERGQSPILIEQQNEGLQLLHGRGQSGYRGNNKKRSGISQGNEVQTSAEGSTEEQEVNEADFTESAFLAPETDNRAELPDGVRSETVTLTRDGKRRRHLNRAEQEYVKKIAGLFGVDVIFENVREKTGIAADSYYDGSNNIHMDFSVADPLNILIKHELTHFGEESREYNDFVRLVKDSKVFRDWINSKISGEKNISAKSAQYRQQIMDRYENAGEKLTVTGADGEMTANFVADTLFTDNGSGLDALIRQAEAKDRPVLIQWIIDFVKSVKSLFKGQYVPPEVLRLERKYVQMLKDAQSSEGQKNTVENNGVRYSIAVESNNSSIKQQLREHLNEVNAMSPVAEVQYTPTNKKNLRTQALQEFKKIGYKVERQGFGIIEIGDKQIEKSLEYITTDGERAALLAVPKVLKRGIEISGHKDHKGRSYGTITIAAPVSINGKIGDIAVVVKVTGKNRYSTHRILMPDGSEFIFEENKNTEPTSSDMLAQKSDQGTDISSVSDIIVPQSDTSVNTSISEKAEDSTMKFSIPEDQSALLDRYDRGEISRQEYLEESNKNWQRAVEEYGTIPEGEAPYDNIPVPTAVEDGRETKRFVRTVIEGGALPKRMIEDLGSEILAGNMSYEPVSDKSAQEYADKQINTGQAEQKWNDTVNKKSIITKDDIAVGEKLLIKAIKEHDTKRVLELTAELSDIFTRAGQTVQAASMFKKMTGMGKLVAVQRFVNSLNNDLEQKYGKKAPVLRIDEILAEQLTQIPQGEDPQNIYTEVIKDIASQVPVTFLEKLNAWRYLAMLFNPKTHIRNIVGNGIFIPSVRIKDYAAAALESAFVKNGERTKSIVIDKKYKDFADKMLKDNLVKQSLKEGRKTDELQLAEYRRIFKNEFLEKLRQLNFGALEAEDFFAKTRHFRRALAGYLQANKADLNNIDSGLLARAQEYAIKEAAKATFNDASEIANAISKFAGKNKATDVLINGILPFKRTPINIVKRGIEYSPIGLTATIIKGSLDLKNGKITAAEYIDGLGAGISGSVVFALGALLASLGMATGGFGSDDEDKFKKLNGEQEYSLVINGKSYTVDWAVPAAIPFFIGVETFNSLFDDNEDFTLSDITEVMWNSLEPITNLSMLSGVQDMISSVQYAAENRSIQSIAGAAVSSYISQFVPSIFGAVSRTIDDTRYSSYTDKNSQLSSFTQGIINSIRAKLPNVISKRPAYIDEWGRTESTGSVIERLFSNFISPGYFSEEQYTALDNEIQRLADSTGENSVYPGYAPKSFEVNGETKYLTAEEYQQYAAAKGQYSLQYISEFMSSAAYNRLNDGERVSVIENLYKYANAKAKAEVSDYDITKSFKTVSQWEKSGRSPVIYYISLAIK